MNASIISSSIISIFIVLIVLGFVFGYIRGLNKSLTRFIMVLVVSVLSFFVIPPITKAIVNMDISKLNIIIGNTPVVTLQDLITSLLREVPFIEDILTASPTFETFIELVPQMLSNVILFIVFFFLLKWFTMIIYWIIAGVCFNKKKMAGKEKHNFIGAVIGAVQGLIVAIIIFVPVFGVLETAQPFVDALTAEQTASGEVSTDTDNFVYYVDEAEGDNKVSELEDTARQIGVYTDAANNNWVFKMLSAVGIRKMSVAMFDGLTTIKQNKVEFKLRRETGIIADAYPYFKSLIDSGFDIKDSETLKTLKDVINTLYKSNVLSGMVREVVPYVAQVWTNDSNADFCGIKCPTISDANVDELFKAILKNVAAAEGDTIKNDITTGIDLLMLVNDAGLMDAVAGDADFLDILNDPNNEGLISKIISKAIESETLKAVLPKVVDIGMNYVYEALGIDPESIADIQEELSDGATWETEKVLLQDIFDNILKLNDAINDPNAPQDENVLYRLDFSLLGQIMDDMRFSALLGPSSNGIMNALLKSGDVVGENSEVLNKLIEKLNAAWNDKSVRLAPTFGAMGDALKLAKEMKDNVEGGLDVESLGSIIEQLASASEDSDLVKDIVDELVNKETLGNLGLDEDVAGVVSDTIGSIIGANYEETGGSLQDEIEAAKDVFDVVNKVLSNEGEAGTEPGQQGKTTLDKDEADKLVDSLSKSTVLLDKLTEQTEDETGKTAVQDVVQGKFDDETKGRLESAIGNVEDSDVQQKLRDLFGFNN